MVVELWATCVTMAATGEELQKLGKPPIYSGKEDEWNEWNLAMKSNVSLLYTQVPASPEGAEDPREGGLEDDRTRVALAEEGATAAAKLFHVLVMNVRGPELAAIRGIADVHGALAWRALIARHAPNTAPRAQSFTSAVLNVKCFPSELEACEIALDEWQENVRKWASVSGERFNSPTKKALSVRAPLQMQNLYTFKAMAAVTLQFLQRYAQ